MFISICVADIACRLNSGKIFYFYTQHFVFQERNSPPPEGWLRLKGEDGVVKQKNTLMEQILTHIRNIPIQRNFVENLPFNPHLIILLKEKRKAGILGEVLFWKKVHARVFHNIDFDRQRIIGNYIVDFYVKALGLVIEIDGSSHDEKEVYDGIRQEYLESLGLLVFRVDDFDIRNNLSVVMRELEEFIILNYGTTPSSKIL